jgi:hypothetical protein
LSGSAESSKDSLSEMAQVVPKAAAAAGDEDMKEDGEMAQAVPQVAAAAGDEDT